MAVGTGLLPWRTVILWPEVKLHSDVRLQLLVLTAQMTMAQFFFPLGKQIHWNCTGSHLFLQKREIPLSGAVANMYVLLTSYYNSNGSMMLHVSRWVMLLMMLMDTRKVFKECIHLTCFPLPPTNFFNFK